VLRSLRHPCIPALHEALTTGDGERRRAWLAMDFVPGRTLRAEMSAERHGLTEALAILAGVAEVLAYLHELTPPVIHRDLKP
jgi:serine/threonine protein kinase